MFLPESNGVQRPRLRGDIVGPVSWGQSRGWGRGSCVCVTCSLMLNVCPRDTFVVLSFLLKITLTVSYFLTPFFVIELG